MAETPIHQALNIALINGADGASLCRHSALALIEEHHALVAEVVEQRSEARFARERRDEAIAAADRLHQQLLALAEAVAPVLADVACTAEWDAAIGVLAETRRMFGGA